MGIMIATFVVGLFICSIKAENSQRILILVFNLSVFFIALPNICIIIRVFNSVYATRETILHKLAINGGNSCKNVFFEGKPDELI